MFLIRLLSYNYNRTRTYLHFFKKHFYILALDYCRFSSLNHSKYQNLKTARLCSDDYLGSIRVCVSVKKVLMQKIVVIRSPHIYKKAKEKFFNSCYLFHLTIKPLFFWSAHVSAFFFDYFALLLTY